MEDYKKYVTDSLVKKTVILPEYDMWGHTSYKVSLPYYHRLIPLHQAVGGFAPEGYIGASVIATFLSYIEEHFAVPGFLHKSIWEEYIEKMYRHLYTYDVLTKRNS
jgi:hypothetical protein